MRVLHLLASPVFSGPAESVALLALLQRQFGHQVTVAIDRKRLRVGSEELAFPRLQALGLLDEAGLELSVKSGPMALASDVLNLRHRAVDVVHAHFSHDHLLAWLGLPRGARLVRSFHAPRSVRRLRPRADAVTVPYEALLPHVEGTPAMVLPALVGPAFQPASDRAGVRRALALSGAPLIGVVSTFQASRRHDVVVDAFALVRQQHPGAHLVLTGDGALEPIIRGRVLSLGLQQAVTFTGYQQADDFTRVLQAVDELWVLGLGNDFAGRAAAQARACGARVVAVDEGALARYADAVVAPSADAVALACGGARREVMLESAAQVAARVVDLYQRAGR